ncbi:hypothetical protein LY78DRAFT_589372 [Colletotrichum sublineola]|nr:hypothetical protein LY78DRAFT_589372 [Colletotrichum sublineola]
MRHSLMLFLVPAIVSAQADNVTLPVIPQTGGLCCEKKGFTDPSGTCSGKGLYSFCVSSLLSHLH